MASNIINMDGGHTFDFTATGAITSGALLIVGNTPMIALESATGAGVHIGCAVGCAAIVTKIAAASTNWAAGGRVYYKATGGNKLTGVAAVGKLVGYGLAITATGATSGKVRLISGPMVSETAT